MTTPAPTFDNNAFAMLEALLQQWGLSSLSSDVRDMLTAGDTAEVIPIKLRQTEAYKTRFKGNADRIKAGLPALSEAEYLSTEASLRTIVRQNVGSGEYDTKDVMDKLLAANVNPQLLSDRFVQWQENWELQPQDVKDAWAAHGYTPRDALRAVMDPSVNDATLKRQASVYSIGAEAVKAFGDDRALDTTRLGQLADYGVSKDQAEKGYKDIAGRLDYEGFLARSAGMDLSLADQEDAALLGDQRAEQQRKKVLNTDEARFNENYLGTQQALGKSTAGSY